MERREREEEEKRVGEVKGVWNGGGGGGAWCRVKKRRGEKLKEDSRIHYADEMIYATALSPMLRQPVNFHPEKSALTRVPRPTVLSL